MGAFPLELQSGHLDHLQCPTVQVEIHESLKMVLNQTLKSRETKVSSSPSKSPQGKQAS